MVTFDVNTVIRNEGTREHETLKKKAGRYCGCLLSLFCHKLLEKGDKQAIVEEESKYKETWRKDALLQGFC